MDANGVFLKFKYIQGKEITNIQKNAIYQKSLISF